MDATPKYFGVHTPPYSADPVAYDTAVAALTADVNRIRYQAQSTLTGLITQPELPTLEQARDITAWANRTRTK